MSDWPALRAARTHSAGQRLPLVIDGRKVGSVARAALPRLQAWPQALRISDRTVTLLASAAEREWVLADINGTLRDEGLITAWRDELFAVVDPSTGEALTRIERAASRFWGTLTRGAHANGYVADEAGRPVQLWIAQRAHDKPTDPGLYDNLIGGGVPSHQSPLQALQREAWEEAGLLDAEVQHPRPGRVLRLLRDIPEGLQFEDLYSYDIALLPGRVPVNQDGEVQGFQCLPIEQALALAAGSTMTVDAALVTLDFALRHRLLLPDTAQALAGQMHTLFVAPHLGDQMA